MVNPYGTSPIVAAGQWKVGGTGAITVTSVYGIGSMVRTSAGLYTLTLLTPFTNETVILTAPVSSIVIAAFVPIPQITYPVIGGTLPATATIAFTGITGVATDLASGSILQVIAYACFDGVTNFTTGQTAE